MTDPGTGAAVRIRPTAGERAFFLLVCSFSPLIFTLFFTEAVLDVPWPFLVGFVVALVGADQVVRRNGIELTPKEAVVRTPLWSTKRVRWGLVLNVTVEDTSNGRRIVLWTAGDSPAEPRHATPVYVSRRQLHETYELVHACWMRNRGY
jgi:hypothetical protein